VEHVTQHLSAAGETFRIFHTVPSGQYTSTTVLSPSGRVGRLDADGPETRLLRSLAHELASRGIQALRFDTPERAAGKPATAADEDARAARLAEVLRLCDDVLGDELTLLGISLGGRAVLRLLEAGRPDRPVERAVLVGTVLEEPMLVDKPVRAIHLVYGARDLIAYVASNREAGSDPGDYAVISPDMYGEWTRRRLIAFHPLEVAVHLLDGLGHTLEPVADVMADPVDLLASLSTARAEADH
jgi:hypothetical protein